MIIALGGVEISIHALREEGDGCPSGAGRTLHPFLSTPSARRATDDLKSLVLVRDISIHALREEGDCLQDDRHHESGYFYPRPPRGGRQEHSIAYRVTKEISIHALREEGDDCPC